MATTLELFEERYLTRIEWVIDGDEGATLGEGRETRASVRAHLKKLEGKSGEDAISNRQHWAATLAALDTSGVKQDERGFYWETIAEAKAALRVIRLAVKTCEHPWPDWALKAKAAGWTAPKGWKP